MSGKVDIVSSCSFTKKQTFLFLLINVLLCTVICAYYLINISGIRPDFTVMRKLNRSFREYYSQKTSPDNTNSTTETAHKSILEHNTSNSKHVSQSTTVKNSTFVAQSVQQASTPTTQMNTKLITQKPREPPLILMWYHPFQKQNYGPPPNSHCGCKYTYNRSLASTSDAIVFYSIGINITDLPPPNSRNAKQRYVWWSREPPTHVKYRNQATNFPKGYFNWTMTYGTHSDVPVPWGTVSELLVTIKKENRSLQEIMSKKNRTAAAIVSNCGPLHGPKARLKMIKELSDMGLDMEKYGKCFKKTLPPGFGSAYKRELYKFYFAFENSYHCKGYITEKFWVNGLLSGSVPVVWGDRKETYEAVAPRHSFIHVEDFDSLEELAKYLKYLDKNDTAYLEYLAWRDPANITDEMLMGAHNPSIRTDFSNCCELCRFLLKKREDGDESESIVESLEDFVYSDYDKDCLRTPGSDEIYWKYDSVKT